MTTPRLRMDVLVPEGFQAAAGLEKYVARRVDRVLFGLVKLRASMINGCTFCVDMHATALVREGQDLRRVVAVAAWRESPFFTKRERVALDLTEAVTHLGDHGVPDEVWDAAIGEFGDVAIADLVLAIATINVWNRVAMSSRTQPPPLAV